MPKALPGETPEAAKERQQREIDERKHKIERLRHDKTIRQLEQEMQVILKEPPDPASRYSAMFAQQVAIAEAGCRTIAQAFAAEQDVLKKINDDPTLPKEAREAAQAAVTRHFKSLRYRIEQGDTRA